MQVTALGTAPGRCPTLPALILAFLLPQVSMPCAAAGEPQPETGVHFPTSCASQRAFDGAVELLHSFEYPDAEQRFRAILEQEPDCGMARWGIAMTLWHPLWAPPDRAALEAGERLLAGVEARRLSAREAGYVAALAAFFAPGDVDLGDRAARYRARMQALHQRFPEDDEAAVFYALALLASAPPGDKSYRDQLEAAAVLDLVRTTRPRHPGVLHYLIHSYDYPSLAHRGLDAAMIYAQVAPDSAHAQHMPSHIFTRLGLWSLSAGSNVDSTASATAYTARAQLPGHYDEGLHSIDYLMYALLQMADDEAARRLLERLHELDHAHPETFKVAYAYAAAPARFALERRQWDEASRLQLTGADFPWQDFGWARSIHHFARGLGAARGGRVEAARAELQAIRDIAATLPQDTLPYWRQQVFVQDDALAAWIALARGEEADALALAERAADREDAVDKHPVTPGEVLPARELYADLLLELGRPQEARTQYLAVLASAPGRTNALLGAARAAVELDDPVAALDTYRKVLAQVRPGDPARDGIREAKAYVEGRGPAASPRQRRPPMS